MSEIDKSGRVSYVVKIGEKKFEPGDMNTCYAISVVYKANKIPHATVTFLDGSVARGDFELSSSSDINPGAEVIISMGYKGTNEEVFRGVIVKHSIKLSGSNSYTSIECKDPVIKMTMGRHSRVFGDGSAAAGDDVHLKKIFADNGLAARLTTTGDFIQQTGSSQYDSSDWDFVMSRTEINGKILMIKKPAGAAGKIVIENPSAAGEARRKLAFGKDLFDFESEANALTQVKSVESSTWNGDTQTILKSTKAAASTFTQLENTGIKFSDLNTVSSPATLALFHAGEMEKAELDGWSKAVMEKAAHGKTRGSFKIYGDPGLSLGDVVELSGIGTKFSGKILVTGVTQEYSPSSWFTWVYFGMDEKWHAENFNIHSQPAAGLAPGVSGLQIGKILKRDGDPGGKFRLQVKLPMIDPNAKFWARMLFDYAGSARGTFFWPEVDDEVLVGFLNDDPRNPVILGSLFNKIATPVLPPTADNDIKAIITKSDLRLEFNDKDKVITIKTPGGNTVTLDDKEKQIKLKDQHGNEVVMNSSAITLKSAGELKLSAAKNITIASSAGDITMEGKNITSTAKMKFAASGNAGAEIKTSAIAVLKGSLVQIN